MSDAGPTRTQSDLAEMVEMLLDKGIVINADIAVSIGETELLGIRLRAAIASFETAAEYGLAFPEGTDTEQLEAATRRQRRTPPVGGTASRPGGPTDVEDDESADTDEAERDEADTDEAERDEAEGDAPEAAATEETDGDD